MDNLQKVKEQCEAAHKQGGYEGKAEVTILEVDMTKREALDGVLGKLNGKKVDVWVVFLLVWCALVGGTRL